MIKHYSHTSTTTFRRCNYKFQQLYMLSDEEAIDIPEGLGSRTGKAGHIALKAFYSGLHYKKAEDHAYEEFSPMNEQELKEFNRLRSILTYYWTATLGDRWKVISVEQEVKVGKYMGIMDLVVETPNGQIFIVDHKFQKSKSLSGLATNNQVSFYLLLARELGLKVDGLLYNIIPTGTDKPEAPIRKLCFRTPRFLDNFKVDLDAQIEQMVQFQLDPKPYRNFTDNCQWDCAIKDYCLHRMETA